MLTSNPITGAMTGTPTASNSVPVNMQINQSDFLRLITTQLQNQNPLSPADPSQFVSQLEGMSEVSSMQSMQTALASSQVMSGTSLLGHSVLAPGTTATLATGGSISGAVQAPAGATALNVSITDSTGAVVNTFKVMPASTGLTSFSWNGSTAVGTTAAAGQYGVQVSATVDGQSQAVSPLVVSKVGSVTIDPNTQAVDVNTDSGTVPLSSVVSVM